jgi:hypothetical protein
MLWSVPNQNVIMGRFAPSSHMFKMAARLCEVCNQEQYKYKCPTCRITYCSVPCFKRHKQEPCQAPPQAVATTQPFSQPQSHEADDDKDNDLLSEQTLNSLAVNRTLQSMLSNPHLRAMLDTIDSSRQPGQEVKAAMAIPIFQEFADECLRHCGVDVGQDAST